MKNLIAFKELIEKYESITLAELQEKWDLIGSITLNSITGFGNDQTCILCIACRQSEKESQRIVCGKCLWETRGFAFGCLYGESSLTYSAISSASSPEELLIAVQNRSKYMREYLTSLNLE